MKKGLLEKIGLALFGFSFALGLLSSNANNCSNQVYADGTSTFDFSQISGFNDWGSSYTAREVNYEIGKVKFASANHSTTNITNIPVTKGSNVEFIANTGVSISGFTFTCTKWGTKGQTISYYTSSNSGTSYSSKSGGSSTNFTLTASNLTSVNALKFSFSSSSNQVGISSLSIDYTGSPGFTVTYDLNDGTGTTPIDETVYTKNSEAIVASLPNDITRNHFKSLSWNTNADGTGTDYESGSKITMDTSKTLYAKWVIDSSLNNPLTIADAIEAYDSANKTANLKGAYVIGNVSKVASFEDGAICYYINDSVSTSITAFEMYNGKDLNNASFTSINDLIVGTQVTVYGNITKYNSTYELAAGNYIVSKTLGKISVSFNPNEGTGTMEQQEIDRGDFTLPECGFTRTNYKFIGWKLNNSGNILPIGTVVSLSSNSTFYAQWSLSYTVEFSSGEGTGTMASVSDATSPYVIPVCTFTNPQNKFFHYWTILGDESGAKYNPSDEINLSSATTTLVAHYDYKFTITYTTNEGSGEMTDSNSPFFNGTEVTILNCSFTPATGRVFKEWKDSNNNAYDEGDTITITSNIVLTAQWEDAPITASYAFSSADGTDVETKTVDLYDGTKKVASAFLNKNASSAKMTWNNNSGEFRIYAKSSVKITCNEGFNLVGVLFNMVINANSKGGKPTPKYYAGDVESEPSFEDFTGTDFEAKKALYFGESVEEFVLYADGTVGNFGLISISAIYEDEAGNYANLFLTSIGCDSTGNTAPDKDIWDTLALYFDDLSNTSKLLFKNGISSASGTNIEHTLATYDYIINKYGTSNYSNFMERAYSQSSNRISLINNTDNISVWIIGVVSLAGLSVIGVYFFKKRKETN